MTALPDVRIAVSGGRDSGHSSPRGGSAIEKKLRTLRASGEALSKLVVRVRSLEHFLHVHDFLEEEADVLTGYIFPKFNLSNAEAYLSALRAINDAQPERLYAMPIIESRMMAHVGTRRPFTGRTATNGTARRSCPSSSA